MTVELFDFGDGVPSQRTSSDISAQSSSENHAAPPKPNESGSDAPHRSQERPGPSTPTHTSIAEKPRTAIRGFSLVLAVVGHALIGSLIAAGGHLVLGAVASVAVMGCSAALVATEALANQ